MARRLSIFVALFTMTASGWYVAVYLARWEWNRAIIAAVIFVAAEVALMGVFLIDRLVRLQRRVDQLAAPVDGQGAGARPAAYPDAAHTRRPHADPRVVARLREAAPPPRKPFAWLSDSSRQMSVFVPVLLGAGVLLSGAAWVVERVARQFGGRVLDRRVAGRLESLALPPRGLLDEYEHDPFSPAS